MSYKEENGCHIKKRTDVMARRERMSYKEENGCHIKKRTNVM